MGPSLLQEAQNALDYSESVVAKWLAQYMFREMEPERAQELGVAVAQHFNDATKHKSHGRRIDRDEARANNLTIVDLEADQALQESVLTSYHLMTIGLEQSLSTKVVWGTTQQVWIKNFNPPPRPTA